MQLHARTNVRLSDAARRLTALADHLEKHGLSVQADARSAILDGPQGRARLEARPAVLEMEAGADDADALEALKYLLSSHLGVMAREEAPEILWQGDGAAVPGLPELREMTVTAVRDVTPGMRRLTLRGRSLGRFATMTALHAKLLVPHADAPAQRPCLTARGLVDWGPECTRPAIRKYTIRRVDPEAGLMDIDFVRHAHGGPGARFAERARPGDTLGLLGPGGGSAPVAEWNLFAGDETALPAIARLLEALPRGARARAVIEVAGPQERQSIETPATAQIEWLYRGRAGSRLDRHLEDVAWPDHARVFAWAGSEFDTFRRIRADWRKRRGLVEHQHLAVAYWRAGKAQH